jgi:hypothetical protein
VRPVFAFFGFTKFHFDHFKIESRDSGINSLAVDQVRDSVVLPIGCCSRFKTTFNKD